MKFLLILLIIVPVQLLAETKFSLELGQQNLLIDSYNQQVRIKTLGTIALDKTIPDQQSKLSESVNQFTFGIAFNINSKLHITYLKTDEINCTIDVAAPRLMLIQALDIVYQHSFNNYGINQGFYVNAGLSQITIDYQETKTEYANNFTNNTLIIGFGYEHTINKHFIFNIGARLTNYINVELESKEKTTLQYKKFYKDQPWWDDKDDAYKAKNAYKYFTEDYYINEQTFGIKSLSITIGYIF